MLFLFFAFYLNRTCTRYKKNTQLFPLVDNLSEIFFVVLNTQIYRQTPTPCDFSVTQVPINSLKQDEVFIGSDWKTLILIH